MKRIIVSILILLGLGLNNNSSAQEFSKSDLNKISFKIDSVLNLYQKYGSLTKDEESISEAYVVEFAKLFTSMKVMVLNDLDPTAKTPADLNISTYITNAKAWYSTGIGIDLSITNKSAPIAEGNAFNVIVSADKKVLGYYKENTRVEKTFKLNFYIKFSKDLSSFSIDKIVDQSVLIITDSQPQQTSVQKQGSDPKPLSSSAIINENYKLNIEKADNLFKAKDYTNARIFYEKAKKIKSSESYPDKKILKIEKILDRGPYLMNISLLPSMSGMSMNDFVKGSYAENNENVFADPTIKSKFGYGASLTFERIFKKSSKVKKGIGLGFGFSNMQTEISLDKFVRYYDTKDVFVNDVNRRTKTDFVKETADLMYLDIPLYFKLLKDNNEKFSYYCNLGLKYSLLLSQKYSSEAEAEYWGKYRVEITPGQFFEFEMTGDNAENFGFGYGKYKLSAKDMDMKLNTTNISAFLQIGTMYKLSEKMKFNFGLFYMQGFSNLSMYNGDGEDYFLSKTKSDLNTLSGISKTIKTSSFGGDIGITYKLSK